jgi:hypothetical protein
MKPRYPIITVVFSFLLSSCDKQSDAPIVPPAPIPPQEQATATDALMKQGLLVYYPFNSGPKDESSNGYDVQTNGPALTTNRFGKPNSAYNFNGISDFMVIPPIEKADSLRDVTISVWVRPADTTRNVIMSFLLPANMLCTSYMAIDKDARGFKTHHQMITNYTPYSCTSSVINYQISDVDNLNTIQQKSLM